MNSRKPRLAITIGDAAGVGPELALRVLDSVIQKGTCVPILCGDAKLVERVAAHLGIACPPALTTDAFDSGIIDAGGAHLFDCGNLQSEQVVPGTFSAETGRASFESVCTAIDLAVAGKVDAIVTGPIQKEAWNEAGIKYPGHTELLAERAGSQVNGKTADVRMMLASDEIACVLETIHVPLADVPGLLRCDSLVQTMKTASETMRRRGRRDGREGEPVVAVCGLNPHAGENGLFSHGEEEAVIVPAIKAARELGLDVIGPLPPDTAFTPAMRKTVDVYVCMYHDQGLIPLKALSFDDAVNVTLGLPIIRTSVDHGTAMDIAWKSKAKTGSMLAAIKLATELASTS